MIHREKYSLFLPSNYELRSALRTRSKLARPRPSADLNPISYAVLRDTRVVFLLEMPGRRLDDRADPNVRERSRQRSEE